MIQSCYNNQPRASVNFPSEGGGGAAQLFGNWALLVILLGLVTAGCLFTRVLRHDTFDQACSLSGPRRDTPEPLACIHKGGRPTPPPRAPQGALRAPHRCRADPPPKCLCRRAGRRWRHGVMIPRIRDEPAARVGWEMYEGTRTRRVSQG